MTARRAPVEVGNGCAGISLGGLNGVADRNGILGIAMTQLELWDLSRGRRERCEDGIWALEENWTRSREHAAIWERRFQDLKGPKAG